MPRNRDRVSEAVSKKDDVYNRPSDWLAMPTIVDGDQKVAVLVAVFNTGSNLCVVKCTGRYTVDWGDGSATEGIASNTAAQHTYTWASVSGTDTSRGYRQAILTLIPRLGDNLTAVDLSVRHTSLTSQKNSQWLEVVMAGSYVASLILRTATTGTDPRLLEKFTYVGASSLTSWANLFFNCNSLQSVALPTVAAPGTSVANLFIGCDKLKKLPPMSTTGVQNFSYMFASCFSLRDIPFLDTSSGTNFSYMFSNTAIRTIPLLTTSSGTNFSFMFSGCSSLETIPLINTASGGAGAFASMFAQCASLISAPNINTSSGTGSFANMFTGCVALQSIPNLVTTGATDVTNAFTQCPALQSLPALDLSAVTTAPGNFVTGSTSLQASAVTGLVLGHSYATCELSTTEIIAIFNNLGTSWETMNLDVQPASPYWAIGDTITGTSSGATCVIANRTGVAPNYNYTVKNRSATPYTLGEILTNGSKTADQGPTRPTFTGQTLTISTNWGYAGASGSYSIATGKKWVLA